MSDTGPGRFYSPTDFPIVQKLMSGEIKPAAGTTIELGVLGRQHGLPSDGAMAELDQYFAAPTADDFSTRAFVFGEVSAKISGTVSVAADGKITLQNVIIKPFDDHFNFNSDKPHTFGGVTADIYNYVMGPSYHANGNNVPLNMVGTGKVFGDYQIVSAPWYDRLHGVSAYLQPLENANPPSKGNTDNLSPQSPVVQPSYSPPVPDGVLLGTIDSPRLNSQNNQTAFPLPPLSRYARELAGPFRAIPNNYSTQAPGQDSSVPCILRRRSGAISLRLEALAVRRRRSCRSCRKRNLRLPIFRRRPRQHKRRVRLRLRFSGTRSIHLQTMSLEILRVLPWLPHHSCPWDLTGPDRTRVNGLLPMP